MKSPDMDDLWEFKQIDGTLPQHEPLMQVLGLLVLGSAAAEASG